MSPEGKWMQALSFATDAAIAKDKVRIVAIVEKHKPIVYPIAVVASTQQKATSRRQFIGYGPERRGAENPFAIRVWKTLACCSR